MKSYYLIATTDRGTNRLYYHTGKESPHGGEILGDVISARKFESMKDIANWILNDTYAKSYSLGVKIVHIEDVTIEKMIKDMESGNYTLYNNFHDPMYV